MSISTLPARTPAVVMPNVAGLLVARLVVALKQRPEKVATGVTVATAVPVTQPPRLVTFRRDGGPRLDLVRESARVGVNVWGRDDDDADALCALVRALLPTFADGAPLSVVGESSGPIDVTEPSGQARRYLTLECIARGQQL